MPSGKYQSFLKILKYFTFPEFQEQFNFCSSDPPAFKFPRLLISSNCYIYVEYYAIYRSESRYTKSFLSYEHLYVSRRFPEWPQRVQQPLKKNDLKEASYRNPDLSQQP